MSIGGLFNQPLSIQRRGVTGTDEYNNEVTGTTATVATVGYVEQTEAKEVTVDRQTFVTDWRVFLPEGTAIDGSDRIVHGTKTLEVVGAPHEVWNPRAKRTHHLEIRAREVTG